MHERYKQTRDGRAIAYSERERELKTPYSCRDSASYLAESLQLSSTPRSWWKESWPAAPPKNPTRLLACQDSNFGSSSFAADPSQFFTILTPDTVSSCLTFSGRGVPCLTLSPAPSLLRHPASAPEANCG